MPGNADLEFWAEIEDIFGDIGAYFEWLGLPNEPLEVVITKEPEPVKWWLWAVPAGILAWWLFRRG